MKKTLQHCLAIALGCAIAMPLASAQTEPKDYKIVLEATEGEGDTPVPMPWGIYLGAAQKDRSLVWVDFNGNGKRDANEGWNDEATDSEGLWTIDAEKSNLKLTIYGPVTTLFCGFNNLIKLETKGNPALEKLAAQDNSIAIVDLSANTNLTVLSLSKNQIKRIDLTGLSKLRDLRVAQNPRLSELDLSPVKALQVLDISETKMSKLPQGNLSEMIALNISTLPGFELDLKRLPKLSVLNMADCAISELEFQYVPELKSLWAPNNKLAKLDLSNNLEITQMQLNYNELKRVDLSKNIKLSKLYLGNNQLSEVLLPEKDSKLLIINYSGNKGITNIDISKLRELRVLQLDATGVSKIDISQNPELEELTIFDTELSELDLSKNKALLTLNISDCKFTKIDVTPCPELTTLYCSGNQLTKLDLSKNTKLENLKCQKNQLSELVIYSPALKEIGCYSNGIKKQAMSRLIESLPTVSRSNKFFVVDLSGEQEGNQCTIKHVNQAKAKGWSVLNWNTAGGRAESYPGYNDSSALELEQHLAKVYPSVTSEMITISGASGKYYSIYNLEGAIVAQGLCTEELQTVAVDTLTEGTYFVKISGVAKAYRIRIVR